MRFRGVILSCLVAFGFSGAASAASIYAPWSNGPSQSPNFFPIAVFWQAPNVVGYSGAYPTIAAAAAGEHINIFLGMGPWPERFGSDNGELEAIKANNLYVVGGVNTPYNENTSVDSVASVLALANSIGATANVIGYNAGDEPDCSTGAMQAVPSVVQGINSFDPTRIVTYNETAWMLAPFYVSCLSQAITSLQSTSIASFDYYPLTDPYVGHNIPRGDFLSVHNDSLWMQGLAVQALAHYAAPNQPLWVFVESGGDNLGFSEAANFFSGTTTNGSNILTNSSGWSSFTAAWLGLTVSGSGIPANTTITQIIDATHARMSSVATSSNANETVTVTGGVSNSDCVAGYNICVTQGNAYRPTPKEVNSEVWMSIINGANGIEYFCHDMTSESFCLGDAGGGPAAAAAQANLTHINQTVLSYAPVLNAPTTGMCSMDSENYTTGAITTLSTCSNGVITLTTSNPAEPGAVLVKQYGSSTYVFVQSTRRSSTGAVFTMHLPSLAGHTATILYNFVKYYQGNHQPVGKTITLNGNGDFSDTVGQYGFDYQVKIYKIN